MNDNELVEWLFENGGPAIKYRTAAELMDAPYLVNALTNDLLNNPKISSLLHKLEFYGPISAVDSHTLNAVHSGDGAEGVIAKLLELGLGCGVHPFDVRMQVFRQYVCNDFVINALTCPGGQDVINTRAIFIAVLLTSYFIRGRYEYDEIISFAKNRINSLYKVASKKIFDIHLNASELKDYPKRSKGWSDHPVIRPEYDPGCSEMPLPYIHDIFSLAYFPKNYIDKVIEDNINCIVEYILDERFQMLPQGYGLLWYKSNRTYYACGWRPELPCLYNFDSEAEKSKLVLYLDLMSHFKAARKSKWFNNCLNHLEQYKTKDGTYCFPSNYLKDVKNSTYVFGQSMGFEENRKLKRSFEIESTFRMLLIKKRINNI